MENVSSHSYRNVLLFGCSLRKYFFYTINNTNLDKGQKKNMICVCATLISLYIIKRSRRRRGRRRRRVQESREGGEGSGKRGGKGGQIGEGGRPPFP